MTTANTVQFKMDEEWHEVPEKVETFGELREWVVADFRSRELVLLGALQGDVTITQEEMVAWEERPVTSFETLEFLSAEPRALARRTCRDMIDFLDKLSARAEETARFLEAEEMEKYLLGMKDCAEGWSLVLLSYRDLLRLSGMDPSVAEIEGRPLTAVANDLSGLIGRMGLELGKSDKGQIREILMYDLEAYIDPMREAFTRVLDELR